MVVYLVDAHITRYKDPGSRTHSPFVAVVGRHFMRGEAGTSGIYHYRHS